MREFRKLKTLADYHTLDAPEEVPLREAPLSSVDNLYILRMLVRPKYSKFIIPKELEFLKNTIKWLSDYDVMRTGIQDSWCYITIRHGLVSSTTDDEFHFDGSSFRTDIIPERNYIFSNHSPTEYKLGKLRFLDDFDPLKHNLFYYAEDQLKNEPIHTCESNKWYLLSPFCLHRRPKLVSEPRTFYRICFTDIEGRDINNTDNPLLSTPFYGRDPVNTFRNKLAKFGF